MSDCRRLEPLLVERAAGPLRTDDELVLADHLAACARCRAELAAYREVLTLAGVPSRPRPPRGAGQPDLAGSALSAWKRRRGRRSRAALLVAGFTAASVAAGIAVAPLVASRARSAPVAAPAAWQPDVEGALAASGFEATEDDLTPDDVALAALEAASP